MSTKAATIKDTLYSIFFKRTTVYIPTVLVGAYFSNEIVDFGIDRVWKSHNQGKLFTDVLQTIGPVQD